MIYEYEQAVHPKDHPYNECKAAPDKQTTTAFPPRQLLPTTARMFDQVFPRLILSSAYLLLCMPSNRWSAFCLLSDSHIVSLSQPTRLLIAQLSVLIASLSL